MKTFASLPAASFLFAAGLLAQPQSRRPAFDTFEVATIKPTPPEWTGGRYIRMQTAHQLLAKNHAVKTLIAAAFNVSPLVIFGGPAWVDSDHYDIVAEAPGDIRPNLDEQMSMLRRLLSDRFKLTFHRESKELSIYALTVAKSGHKFQESAASPDAAPEGPPPLVFVISPGNARLPGRNATMSELASVLQRAALDRPVIDRTGLSARYDFDLDWAPDETQFGGIVPKLDRTDVPPKPDLFAAIQQQLGLRLEATRGPVPTFVIDQIERPTDN